MGLSVHSRRFPAVACISQGHRLLISTMAPLATSEQQHHKAGQSTARALVLEPRRAILGALRAWAQDQAIDSGDLAVLERVLKTLAAAEHGPDFDLVMRAARRRVMVQARRRRRFASD